MEIKVPEVGESVYEAMVAKWHVQDGATVKKDELLCELETDKITLELNAETAGVISIKVAEGETVKIGTLIATIAEGAATSASVSAEPKGAENAPVLPAARKLAEERGIAVTGVAGSGRGGRVTVEDVLKERVKTEIEEEKPAEPQPTVRTEEPPLYRPQNDVRITRTPMTPIRRRIAERLLAARQQTAMLTTFNEADLSAVIALRKKHKEHFLQKHGVSLGFMSFFVKACCEALREFPAVNASIDGNDIVSHHYIDIGIAIGAEKGLVVPVLRDADKLHFFEIEQKIEEFVTKVKSNKLAIADLEGGTFSISNGGVYGSLLSTPILNPPQSGVLGMHAIQERAVVRDGQIVIRPMMYLAVSYDHRIIDGREAVGFLRKVKECVEDPEELLLES